MRASNSPHQIGRSSSPSGCDTVASSGADKELAPIIGSIHPSVPTMDMRSFHLGRLPYTGSQAALAHSCVTNTTPNSLAVQPIHQSLPDPLPRLSDSCQGGVFLPRSPLAFHQSSQDNDADVSQFFPTISAIISSVVADLIHLVQLLRFRRFDGFNLTSGVTQGHGNNIQVLGKKIQGNNGGIGHVRCRHRRQAA